MSLYDRKPVRLEIFQSLFPKQRTVSYLETPPGARPSSAPISRIVTLDWSPLGNYVATGAIDRRIRVWNPERANVKHSTELRGHTGSVERVAFNPTREAELASCSQDGTIRIWDVRSKANVAEIKTGKECFSLIWRPDGSELLVGTKVCLYSNINLAMGLI
jgi:THO complex subunit 3